MLARIFILVAFFSFLNDASAQFMNTFAGGSPVGSLIAQQCPYNFQQAPQLQVSPEQQRIEAMRQAEVLEREQLRSIDADMAKLQGEIRRAERGIRMRLNPEAARIVLKYMRDRGDGAGLVVCDEPAPPRYRRRVDPGPMDTLTAPAQGVPVEEQQQDVNVPDPQSTSDNRAIDDSRMPAADGAAGASGTTDAPAAADANGAATPAAPVATTPANAPDPKADPNLVKPSEMKAATKPAQAAPVATESDAAAPQGPPPQPEVYDLATDHYARGGVFCVRGRNMWEQYALGNGEVDPAICEQMIGFDRTHLANIQRSGRTSEGVAACEDSLDRLRNLYARLADLDEQHAVHLGNADQYRVEADPTWSMRNRSPRISTGLRNNIHAFVAPLGQVEQIPGVGFSGGWPYRSPTFFSNNYGAGGFNGFASPPYNGYYGYNPGGIGQGGYGCNGVQNPLFQNPWQNGLPPWMNGGGQWGIPQTPQYLPMPNMAGLGRPRYAPLPYGNMQGVPGMPRYAPMPGISNIAGGAGIVPGQLPLGGTLGGQLGGIGAGLGGWGAGAGGISNLISGSYYGATVPVGYGGYQTSYLNTPSFSVPSRLPYAP